MKRALATAAAFLAACAAWLPAHGRQAAAPGPGCEPLETRPPNAPGQRPEFPGQTRACAAPSGVPFRVEVLARGLEHPWSVEPLPDGSLLVTERPGRMRIVSPRGEVGEPIAGLPRVDARGQGGLMDAALSPSFAQDRTIFWSYTEPRGQGRNATSVARGRLPAGGASLEQVQVIFRSRPAHAGDKHFGSRIAVAPDGLLYVTLGERFDPSLRRHAQLLDSHLGKIVRVGPDGSAPPDDPFAAEPGALPGIWTLGHRNVQAAAFDGAGRLWIVEHGAQGGDELNLIQKGRNYGWPLAAYGEEYSGQPIAGAATSRPDMVSPVYYWDPVIAPSGAEFYDGDLFPAWRGSLFTGGLREKALVRLVLRGGRVVGEERLLRERGRRVRDVRQGPDGALYVVTDEDRGELWRLLPDP
ncbi:MAG TPA: PQQ-dependent sugar dehydrogenase [Candidatus Polarisedimenticolia bacterium]|nr:PQQ-dependent sugar dehydrogenase [Candidatus Polarisedimenticolia bacterium]